jgi:hypothetical protein
MSHENFTTPVSTKEPAIMSMTDLTSGSIEVATMIDLVISEDEKHNEQTNESNLPQNNAFTRLIQSSKNNAPAKAITARDRKVSLPKTGKKRKTTHGKHDLSPDFSPRRIEEFPNQCLCEDPPESGNLFCSCCRTNISNKKSCVVVHISSELHLKNRREYEECKRESKTIAQFRPFLNRK